MVGEELQFFVKKLCLPVAISPLYWDIDDDNEIGRLLREVQPELMDGLIQATKDGDQSMFQATYGSETGFIDDDAEETKETESDDEVEGSPDFNMATRWFDGLINKDTDITNEILCAVLSLIVRCFCLLLLKQYIHNDTTHANTDKSTNVHKK